MADLAIHLTLRGQEEESLFIPVRGQNGDVVLSKNGEKGEGGYLLKKNEDSFWEFADKDVYEKFEESKEIIEGRLVELSQAWLEKAYQGVEDSDSAEDETVLQKPGYGPEQIFVENKPFSLRQLYELIKDNDIEISPDFQRHFIWDRTRQSRLIESILLGLPLPAIYFSQYDDGRLTVVDGLQRLGSICNFLDGKLKLMNLEYLENCNGKTYSELKEVLSPLQMRRFGQTQISCFVIDYRSPSQLKFDLFRRLNTAGKPLNRQEIRNCLALQKVRDLLKKMTGCEEFKQATGDSLKDVRMEAQEAALRFIYFYEEYSEENPVGNYKGKMDAALDQEIDILNKKAPADLERYFEVYRQCMGKIFQLFGDQAFRKPSEPGERANPINKLLMLCLSVIVAKCDFAGIQKSPKDLLSKVLQRPEMFGFLTWNTNSKENIMEVMQILKKSFEGLC